MTIVGATKSSIVVLDRMSSSTLEFHLVGSRRFGFYNGESDWDFFCPNTKEHIEFLHKNGFSPKQDDITYTDKQCVAVYEFGTEIDVQVRLDVNLYETVCKWLELHPLYNYKLHMMPKDMQHTVWDIMLAMHQS